MFQAVRRFRDDLRSGQVRIGASVTLGDILVSDALADSVDFLWIDLEHTAMSPETLSGHLLAARAHGVPALVRVAGSATPWIKPVLDSGACGIIVPQVRSADEVREAVADCRYPPLGHREYGPRVPSNYGRDGGPAYVERANRDLFVAVQIENTDALADLDQIAEVAGLDSLAIGPYDLSASLGVMGQLEHPSVVSAIERIVGKASVAGLFVGAGMGPDAQYAQRMIRRGIQWLQVGGDYGYMVQRADQLVAAIRERNGTASRPHASGEEPSQSRRAGT
jgi:2-keto-3-deoxy-L-rhamnonate aldolase RhmA